LIFNLEKCVHRQITATLAAFAAVTGSSKPATDTYPITSALHFAGLPQQPPAGSPRRSTSCVGGQGGATAYPSERWV